MIGRDALREAHVVTLDPIGRFGAGTAYELEVRAPIRLAPKEAAPRWSTLHASNKESEHNILNQLFTPIVIQQYPGQTLPPDFRRRVSHRSVLRGGNQSLART